MIRRADWLRPDIVGYHDRGAQAIQPLRDASIPATRRAILSSNTHRNRLVCGAGRRAMWRSRRHEHRQSADRHVTTPRRIRPVPGGGRLGVVHDQHPGDKHGASVWRAVRPPRCFADVPDRPGFRDTRRPGHVAGTSVDAILGMARNLGADSGSAADCGTGRLSLAAGLSPAPARGSEPLRRGKGDSGATRALVAGFRPGQLYHPAFRADHLAAHFSAGATRPFTAGGIAAVLRDGPGQRARQPARRQPAATQFPARQFDRLCQRRHRALRRRHLPCFRTWSAMSCACSCPSPAA